MLEPRPRDFTAAAGLDRAQILRAIRHGRPGTAMKSFSALISDAEMQDVARFVENVFVACAAHNTRYHTAENGWPNHRALYAPAIPFATGEIAVDVSADLLDIAGRQGLSLFRSACISCHRGRVAVERPLAIAQVESAPAHYDDLERGGAASDHQDDYEIPTIHDFAPVIADLGPSERRGLDVYTRACAQCHAADGSGKNWIGKFLEPGPPDFTSADFAAEFDVERFVSTTLDAPEGTTMPSFRGVLSMSEAHDIASYVRLAFVDR